MVTNTQSLYTSNDRITIVDLMDYTKDVNKIPYGKYGDMLSSGELTVMKFNYEGAYTVVMDRDGDYWKVTYQQKGFIAVLTKVTNG